MCHAGGGGGSRRARPTGTTTLEVEWNQRPFSFLRPAPSLEEGMTPLWMEVLLCWLDTSSFWQERREGGRGGRRRYREACIRTVSGCDRACKREREGGEGGGEGRAMRICK